MNPKFYDLPLKKQQAILNAGFHVFSQNSYKKSPMREIAETAGISKSLLFHYFQNKKDLYLFLAMPLILGSVISFLITPFYLPIIAKRIRNEEQVLEEGLPGYREYKEKVKYRLIPYIW